MLTKAIVESIDGYKAKVRIPTYNGKAGDLYATPTKDLSSAIICSLSNIRNPISVGDVVIVGFEDNDTSKPIIVGTLFRSVKSEQNPDIYSRVLESTASAVLPGDTTIGKVKPLEIQMLTGLKANVQSQLNQLNDKIDNLGSGESIVAVENDVSLSDINSDIASIKSSISSIGTDVNSIKKTYVDLTSRQVINGIKSFDGQIQISGQPITYEADNDVFKFGYTDSTGGVEVLETDGYRFTPIDLNGNIVDEADADAYMVGTDTNIQMNGFNVDWDNPYSKTTVVAGGKNSALYLLWNVGDTFQCVATVSSNSISLNTSSFKGTPYIKIKYATNKFYVDSDYYVTRDETDKMYEHMLKLTTDTQIATLCQLVTIKYSAASLVINMPTTNILSDPNSTYEFFSYIDSIELIDINVPEKTVLNIPTKYNDKPVIKIGSQAFMLTSATKVVIPYTIRYIGAYAFAKMSSLSELVINSDRLSIPLNNCTFMESGNNTSVEFGDNVYTAPISLLCPALSLTYGQHFAVTSVNLNNIKYIERAAFAMCFDLADVDMSQVISIDSIAFAACIKLQHAALKSATNLGSAIFYLDSALKNVYLNANVDTMAYDESQPTFSTTPTIYTNAAAMPIGWSEDAVANCNIEYNTTYAQYQSIIAEASTATTNVSVFAEIDGENAGNSVNSTISVVKPNPVYKIKMR